MKDLKSNLYPCAHCKETGTCANGIDGHSCALCVKRSDFKVKQELEGLPCSVCRGLGIAEPSTELMHKRTPVIIAVILPTLLFSLIFIAIIIKSEYFTQILTFASTLLGMILTFWLSKNNS